MTKQQSSVGGQWARQQQEGMKRQDKKATENEARRVVEGGEADRRSQERGIVHDQRGQEQLADKNRALKSQQEGPAAYAPQQDEPTDGPEAQRQRDQMAKTETAERESVRASDRDPAKKKTGEFCGRISRSVQVLAERILTSRDS